jgi:DNA-binding NarL/FixJ family response regulator
VLVAERDGPTRAGIRLALSVAGFEVVVEVGKRDGALEAALEHRPDVALVSTDLPGGGIDLARAVAARLPGTKVVLLTPRPGENELLAGVLAGAVGYLSKAINLERLPHALDGVIRGEVALPRQYTQHLLDELRGRETDREWEVLRLLGESASTVQMAQRLGISEVTVRRHVSSVVGKLGVSDRAGAAGVLHRSTD